MARTVVTKEEFQAWLTAEIRKIEGCETCSFCGVMPLQDLDESGCNWSETIYLKATGVPSEIYRPAIAKVRAEARSRFNIEWWV